MTLPSRLPSSTRECSVVLNNPLTLGSLDGLPASAENIKMNTKGPSYVRVLMVFKLSCRLMCAIPAIWLLPAGSGLYTLAIRQDLMTFESILRSRLVPNTNCLHFQESFDSGSYFNVTLNNDTLNTYSDHILTCQEQETGVHNCGNHFSSTYDADVSREPLLG